MKEAQWCPKCREYVEIDDLSEDFQCPECIFRDEKAKGVLGDDLDFWYEVDWDDYK